jgi:hypothetical protein
MPEVGVSERGGIRRGVSEARVSEFRMVILEAETLMFVDHASDLSADGCGLGLQCS